MGTGSSRVNVGNTIGSHDDGSVSFDGSLPLDVNEGQQGKHMPGHHNFIEGRSEFKGTMKDAQALINTFGGTGEMISVNKEAVDFGTVIGNWVDQDTGEKYQTTRGIIHYGKRGAHIVPSNPNRN